MHILASETVGIAVDYQARLMPVIHGESKVIERSAMLLRGLGILGVPVIASTQCVKVLGDTVSEIKEALGGGYSPADKMTFSVCADRGIMTRLDALGRKNVIVCGVEAHICVLQTVIDLLEKGFRPILVTDCIGSRRPDDKEIAVMRAISEGALVATAESLLFELTVVTGTDTFRAISKLVK